MRNKVLMAVVHCTDELAKIAARFILGHCTVRTRSNDIGKLFSVLNQLENEIHVVACLHDFE